MQHHLHPYIAQTVSRTGRLACVACLGLCSLLLLACGDGKDAGSGSASGTTTTGVATGTITPTVTVATPEAAWRGATLVENDDTGAAETAQIVIDSKGFATAVWSQQDGFQPRVYANRYNPTSQTWGTPVALDNAPAFENALLPKIAVDTAGNALVVWIETAASGNFNNLWASRYDAGSNFWGAPARVEDDVGSVEAAQIAMSPTGNATVVWTRSGNTVMANKFSTSTGWSTATLVAGSGVAPATQPQVSVDNSGNAIAVWQMGGGIIDTIYTSRRSSGSNVWITPDKVEVSSQGNSSFPQIAIDALGNPMVAWQKLDAGGISHIWASRFAGTWGNAMRIDTGSGDAFSPSVAIDTKKNATVVWQQKNAALQSVYAARYTTSVNSWTAPTLLSNSTGSALFLPRLAVDGGDNVVVVWEQFELPPASAGSNIYTTRYNAATGKWNATPQLIETDNPDAGEPQIAVDAQGNAIAVWSQFDSNSLSSIYANYFR